MRYPHSDSMDMSKHHESVMDRYLESVTVCNALTLLVYECDNSDYIRRISVLIRLKNCWSRGHHDVSLVCPEKDCMCVFSDEDLAVELRAAVKSKSSKTNYETDDDNSSYDNDLDSALTAQISDGIQLMQSHFSDSSLNNDVVGNFKLFSESTNKQLSDVENKAMASKIVSSISQDTECSTAKTSHRKIRTCTMCDVQFDSRVKLRKHMYKVHGVEKDVSSPDSHLKRKNKGDAGGYECKVCGRLFQKQQSLAAHCIIHTGDRPYPCRRPGCSKSFRQNSTRLSHEKSQHSEVCSFVCSFCGEGFELYTLLQAHADLEHEGVVDAKVQSTETSQKTSADGVSVKDDENESSEPSDKPNDSSDAYRTRNLNKRNYRCNTCGQSFSSWSALNGHIARKHSTGAGVDGGGRNIRQNGNSAALGNEAPSTGGHVCNVCGRKFRLRQMLTAHSVTHTGVRPYACRHPGCNKRFGRTSTRVYHERTHSEAKPYICSRCGYSCKHKSSLNNHISSKHPAVDEGGTAASSHQCHECGKTFGMAVRLRRHIETDHPEANPKYACPDCPSKFPTRRQYERHRWHTHAADDAGLATSCPVCNYRTINPQEMRVHLYTHTGERPYKCRICEKGFAQLSSRNYHELTHSDVHPFVCNICGRPFKRAVLLKRHLNVHAGYKPKECKECGARFLRTSQLTNHLRVHTGEKPYICEICSQRFSSTSILRRHRLVHTGEKPFSCTVCGHQFTTQSNLRIHMRTHSGERPYECKHCGVKFAHSGSLTQHVAQAHTK